MNTGIYRLVFNSARGLWMVVSEHVISHQAGATSSRTVRRAQAREELKAQGGLATVSIFILGMLLGGASVTAVADPNLPANKIPDASKFQIPHGNITTSVGANAATLNINQSTLKGIIYTPNFDVGSKGIVNFNHTYTGSGKAGTLVRINGPRSVIAGKVYSPNGSVHFINQNGIVFANGSKVNVNGLVASALNLRDSDFLSQFGDLNAATETDLRPAYVWEGDAKGFSEVLVEIEPDAEIKGVFGSSVMVFAPTVINEGNIDVTEGQVVLAAGEKVYLSFAPDLNPAGLSTVYAYQEDSPYNALAGILVEVDSYQKKTTDAADTPAEIVGKVENADTGRIFAQRGNVTLAGYMVNQNGRVTATSSVSQKGSIRLLARDGGASGVERDEFKYDDVIGNVERDSSNLTSDTEGKSTNTTIIGNRTGELTIGDNSITAVLPEDIAATGKANQTYTEKDDYSARIKEAVLVTRDADGNVLERATIADAQPFNPNLIEAIGRQVYVGENAKIVNPAGNISIAARSTGKEPVNKAFDESSRLYIGKNSVIDAAGLKNVSVAMESNFIERLLTGLDLKNNPVNKDAFINRETVWLDVRNIPDARVADVAGFVENFGRSLGERHTTAGQVNLSTLGSIVQADGATIDVSGGSVLYQTGLNRETWLVDQNNQAYAFGDAPVDVEFVGFLGDKNSIDRIESGYTEGKAAGSVNVEAYQLAMAGNIKGGATYGQKQRTAENLGGQLNIELLQSDNKQNIAIGSADTAIPAVIAGASGDENSINNTATELLSAGQQATAKLSADMLNKSGLEAINIQAKGDVSVDKALHLSDGAAFDITGKSIAVNKSITAQSGEITLTATQQAVGSVNEDNSIAVADNVTLKTEGRWTNDRLGISATRLLKDGGSVNLRADDQITLGKSSVVDVSGGAWLQRDGAVNAGDAGSISLLSLQDQNGLADKPYTFVAPQLNGELRGYALNGGQGGRLAIEAPFVTLGNQGFGDARELLLTPSFFQQGGFVTYNLTGRDGVVVRSGTDVSVVAQNYVLDNRYLSQVTSAGLSSFAKKQFLPNVLQSSTSISLATSANPNGNGALPAYTGSGVERGGIVVEKNATVRVASHGQLKESQGQMVNPSISLSAWDNQLSVDGTLQALGGDIHLLSNRPGAGEDKGYVNKGQAIWLGEHAQLLANGYSELTPNIFGLRQGTVYDAGSINIDAQKGFVVAESGALLDVSGVSRIVDIQTRTGQYAPKAITGDAGAVTVSAREGMLLDNTFKADAPNGLGGQLTVRLTNDRTNSFVTSTSGLPAYPTGNRTIEVSQSNQNIPNDLAEGDDLESVTGRVAKVSADDIMRGGFSTVNLASQDYVSFKGDVSLETNRSITVNSRQIRADDHAKVVLTSGIVNLSNSNDLDTGLRNESGLINASGKATASVGSATLDVVANLVDLEGDVALSGFDQTHINSANDIQLKGVTYRDGTTPVRPRGQLTTLGDLTLSAQQIYPTTFTDYKLQADGRTVTINSQAGQRGTVLSAQSQLTIQSDTIEQNGVLKAPFGAITLNANTINLNAGSITSVSADGALIPFGTTQSDGADYLYQVGGYIQQYKPTADATVEGFGLNFDNLADRQINLNAESVNQNADSQVDLNGGGDLLAYEWVAGIGGNNDVLANDVNPTVFGENAAQTWAILPADNNQFGHYDKAYADGSNIATGDAVYLSGVPGLAAGYYTLLPKRYALLPGAKLVTAVNNTQDLPTGVTQVLADGGVLTAGYQASHTTAGYVQTSRQAGFVVRDSAYVDRAAEYKETTASQYFSNNTAVQQAADAGRLSIQAAQQLVLEGVVNATADTGGNGAEVDLTADKLLIVAAGEQQGTVIKDGETYLAVGEDALAKLNAASLLLGGKREQGKLTLGSEEVRVDTGASVEGSEVILAAKETVKLDDGASVKGVGKGASARDLLVTDASLDGDSAVLRVSGETAGVAYQFQNSNADRGELILSDGATVAAEGSVRLDASKRTVFDSGLNLNEGANVAFSSARISLGNPEAGETIVDGLVLSGDQLASFGGADHLTLTSQSTIDLYGDLQFGSQNTDVVLRSAGLAGYQNTGKTTTISAGTITIDNQDNVTFAETPALSSGTVPSLLGDGQLDIHAETIVSGDHAVRIAGYDTVNLTAIEQLNLDGSQEGSALIADQNLNIATAKLTASAGAEGAIQAEGGQLSIAGTTSPMIDDNAAVSSGANIKLSGQQVTLAGVDNGVSAASLQMRGANLSIEANGDNSNDAVIIGQGANVDVSGIAYRVNQESVDLPAGSIAIKSDNGGIEIKDNAKLNLAASGAGKAGDLSLMAQNGNISITGNVIAGKAGQAKLDAKSLDFAQASTALSDFSGAQTYRVREGDVAVGVGQRLQAEAVSIEVDQGAITVNGTIDASGDTGGKLGLYAHNNVTVNDGAALLAKGLADKTSTVGTLGDGGDVVLASTTGNVVVAASGAVIDVTGDQTGGATGAGGTVTLRVDSTQVGNVDTNIASAVTGAEQVDLSPVVTKAQNSIDQTQLSSIEAELTTLKAGINASDFAQTQDGVGVTVKPEVMVKSDADLIVSSALSLNDNYTLTLQAQDNLNVDHAIDAVGSNGGSIRLVAGADSESANAETVVDGNGDITFSGFDSVRVGRQVTKVSTSVVKADTGYIHLAAGNNIDLSNDNLGAAVYTKGLDTSDPAAFDRLTAGNLDEFYGANGGEVVAYAGGDLTGAKALADTQTTQNWLFTATHNDYANDGATDNKANPQIRWWAQNALPSPASTALDYSVFKGFNNGLGTLGGNNVSVKADNVKNVQIAAATSGRMGGDVDSAPDAANFKVVGGGDVRVNAENAISNTLIHVGEGEVSASAKGSIETKLSLMNADTALNAGRDIQVTDAYNATALRPAFSRVTKQYTHSFYTYGERSAVTALSTVGDVSLSGSGAALPQNLNVYAPQGDLNIGGTALTSPVVALFPTSNNANVNLLAGNNLNLNQLFISDVDVSELPSTLNAEKINLGSGVSLAEISGLLNDVGPSAHAEIVADDFSDTAIKLNAGQDVVFVNGDASKLTTTKRTQLIAGNDVLNPNVSFQNRQANDVSTIQAGRDVRFDAPTRSGDTLIASANRIEVNGPGRLQVTAGRDIDLQASQGILSVGNVNNPFLPSAGAGMTIQTGAKGETDYDAVIANYIVPGAQYSSIYLPQLGDYMRERTGDNDLTNAQALEVFNALDKLEQTEFINRVFTAEWIAAAEDVAAQKLLNPFYVEDYTRSERMILALFPEFTDNPDAIPVTGSLLNIFEAIKNETVTNPGDLKLFYSQIKSERGGDIDILVPGGFINVGLAVSSGLAKQDNQLGILTTRGGDINAFVRGDMQVNQSRVFAVESGDVNIYSVLGDIDAGKGEKTVTVTPPPVTRIIDGQVVQDPTGNVAGSGIASFNGRSALVAPYGVVDASESGIVAAELFIPGPVKGEDNITVGGELGGAVPAPAQGFSAPASANPTNAGQGDDSLSDTASDSLKQEVAALPSIISVEVLSLGDGASTPPSPKTTEASTEKGQKN